MPIVRVYPRGSVGSTPSSGNRKPPPPGLTTAGWTEGACRNFRDRLLAIDPAINRGLVAIVATLTQLRNPATPEVYQQLRNGWLQAQRRAGLIRYQWVVEAQRRGVLHLHLLLIYAATVDATDRCAGLVGDWLRIAADLKPGPRGQFAEALEHDDAYARYLLAHAWRTTKHYQRNAENWPAAWREAGRLGRPYAIGGDWGEGDPVEVLLTDREWWTWRRLVRAQMRAAVRPRQTARDAAGRLSERWDSHHWLQDVMDSEQGVRVARRRYLRDVAAVKGARRILRCGKPRVSGIRGLSAWGAGGDLVRVARVVAGHVADARTHGTRTNRAVQCPVQCAGGHADEQGGTATAG